MTDERSRWRRAGWTAGVLATGAIAGGIIAVALPAAANSPTTPSTAASATRSNSSQPPANGPASVRSDEKALTGTDADQAKAAALAAVPGATVYRVETDGDGATYEAHLTKADGSQATVKLDKDFKVTSIEPGMGTTHGRPGDPNHPGPDAGPGGTTPSK